MTHPRHIRDTNPELTYAAWQWLTGQQAKAIPITLVVAIVETLLVILTDQERTDDEIHAALRRAVRLLGTFVTERPR